MPNSPLVCYRSLYRGGKKIRVLGRDANKFGSVPLSQILRSHFGKMSSPARKVPLFFNYVLIST